jgi:hypothetical protein
MHPCGGDPRFWIDVDGPAMLDTAREHELEGVIAEKATSR